MRVRKLPMFWANCSSRQQSSFPLLNAHHRPPLIASMACMTHVLMIIAYPCTPPTIGRPASMRQHVITGPDSRQSADGRYGNASPVLGVAGVIFLGRVKAVLRDSTRKITEFIKQLHEILPSGLPSLLVRSHSKEPTTETTML